MNTLALQKSLIERMPKVEGTYTENYNLARHMWFKVGGPAEIAFEPKGLADLSCFLAERPCDVPITVIGYGSNALIRDGGIPGVVIRLGRAFDDIAIGENKIAAGAGALAISVARAAQRKGLAGLEFLSGIPGGIGGALRMNAGAYGREMKDVVLCARAVDLEGNLNVLQTSALGFKYRDCAVPEGWIFIGADLRAEPGDIGTIATHMAEVASARSGTQPIRTHTGGSTFKNPPGAKAWELIDQAGCRGLRQGGAQVSEQHCNFLINNDNATAADLEELGELVRDRVRKSSGITLEWEIRRLGEPAPRGTP